MTWERRRGREDRKGNSPHEDTEERKVKKEG